MKNTIHPSSWNNFVIGDESLSFSDVYFMYSGTLFEHSFRITKDTEASLEIVDFLLIKVSQIRPSYKSSGDFKNFLFKSCANRSLNYLRSEKRRRAAQTEAMRHGDYVLNSIEDMLVTRERFKEAMIAVKTLPQGMQSIFIHSFINERTPKEIAVLLNVPETSVYTQRSQALKRLRLTLARH
ncbi:RNA polymerase sigma-70 factor (ECF subfamily) [Filimonas zeae]|uniref:RNA polymerase sigma factor 70 region 4 type 2 domain-containing protein n=1 Tax=Filimonas zeae TaxID=1737353 RepID=A0A917MRM2_9BACT|nr:sigma-70 family RNA polymerase sigma factor [Filimonas zeae]MDR6337701.1 RNA polymerase sigma-70 factor (ECF subfamily) [Filimonas zeae]GGH59848.1 hypothetical protein GCM10011379_07080 [Filimonas zeae]